MNYQERWRNFDGAYMKMVIFTTITWLQQRSRSHTMQSLLSRPPSAAIVPDILLFRGWNNYNWSNLVLRTIYSASCFAPFRNNWHITFPFLALSIARERDFVLSSFDQFSFDHCKLPSLVWCTFYLDIFAIFILFYTYICIYNRGQI